jgi:hypothetical protein
MCAEHSPGSPSELRRWYEQRTLEPTLSRVEWVWIFLGVVFASVIYAAGQPIVSRSPDRERESRAYHEIAKNFPRQLPPHGQSPEVYRPAVPFTASVIAKSQDWVISAGFDRLNQFSNLLSVCALAWLVSRYVKERLPRFVVLAALILEPHSPFRHSFAAPIDLLPTALALLSLGFVALEKVDEHWKLRRWALLSVLVGAGVLVHEFLLILAVCALFAPAPARAANDWRWLPLVTASTILLAEHWWITPEVSANGGYEHLVAGFRTKNFAGFGVAWFLVFGPLLFFPIAALRRSWDFLRGRPAATACLLMVAVAAWGERGDTETVLVMASPIVYILIARAMEGAFRTAPVVSALIVAAQLLSSRAFAAVQGPLDAPSFRGDEWERLGSPLVKWAMSYENMWSATAAPAMLRFYAWALMAVLAAAIAFFWRNRRTPMTVAPA